MTTEPEILFEDNHIIAINKPNNRLVQKDITGDTALDDDIREYIRKKYNKPGNVFLGVTHRLDRPASGVLLFARTSKALSRLNKMFREGEIKKTYWAIVKNKPPDQKGILRDYMVKNQKRNKSYCYKEEVKNSKLAVLEYTWLAGSENYHLLEINLKTGRHHQIRAQLAQIGCPIKGDLKYGFPRSNPDGGINLHARRTEFTHPVSKEEIIITAPVPTNDKLWKILSV
jgi:23S rRNA pseudouridine1911/1915/1917 synthase